MINNEFNNSLMLLNNSQLEAIKHIRGPAQIIAGPGSGKTFTIIQRILYLINNCSVDPHQILVVTFSNKAAKEMYDRFNKATCKYGVHFGTFHSLGYQILKESFNFKSNKLLTDFDKRKILSIILKNNGFYELDSFDSIDDILSIFSKCKNNMNQDMQLVYNGNSYDLSSIFAEYLTLNVEQMNIDFDDMILMTLDKLRQNKNILSKYMNTFKYIMIDEFQDINLPQYELIKLFLNEDNNIFVVGDDDQSIYGFRGSDSSIMNQFLDDFINVKQIYMTDNFRSGKEIVSFASKVIQENKYRFLKSFYPVREGGLVDIISVDSRKNEEAKILNILKSFSEEELNDTAIIVRTNIEAKLFEGILINKNIKLRAKSKKKYNVVNSQIFDDYLSFLKFIYEGRKREDFIKIMNKPNRYIRRDALLTNTVSYEDLLTYYKNNCTLSNEIRKIFKLYDLASNMSTSLAISIFRKSLGYDKYLESEFNNYDELIKLSDYIEELFSEYRKGMNLNEFVKKLSKDTFSSNVSKEDYRNTQSIEDYGGVHILTMHASKGLEFRNVILPDINEGVIPPKRIDSNLIEEERRLLYVAITRAKEKLYIISNTERNRRISRFIDFK